MHVQRGEDHRRRQWTAVLKRAKLTGITMKDLRDGSDPASPITADTRVPLAIGAIA